MSYPTYKLIHFFGIFLLMVTVASMLARSAWGAASDGSDPWRRRLGILQGVALLLVLLGGFGLMSRLGIPHTQLYPGWVFAKLAVWATLGALAVIPRKRPTWALPALFFIPVLGVLAGTIALYKPF